jgi:hypothetical protein
VGAPQSLESRTSMATRWRRRRMCMLIADRPAPAALREVSPVAPSSKPTHAPRSARSSSCAIPDAGSITGQVRSIADDGIGIAFSFGERSVAFALAAIAADMTT